MCPQHTGPIYSMMIDDSLSNAVKNTKSSVITSKTRTLLIVKDAWHGP